MLMLAAQEGNLDDLNRLDLKSIDRQDTLGSSFCPLVYCSLLAINISPVASVEIARRCNHTQLRFELIMKTNVYPADKEVIWSGLQLKVLDVSLIKQISWVEKLKLDGNCLSLLPSAASKYFQQVKRHTACI